MDDHDAMSGDSGDGRPGPVESPKRQRQLKRARVGWPSALRELKELLYEVYLAAGTPSLDEIAGNIADDNGLSGAPGRDTVHRVITDEGRPGQQADVVAVATVLARQARWDAPDLAGRVRELWVQAAMAQGAGRPIGDFRANVHLILDGGLGVHPTLDTDGASDRFGILPAYIQRDHDARLKKVVDSAQAGRSGIAVLVGGSSTGKTRSLWEGVRDLPDGWRLWHPLSPTAPEAALATLADIAPKTVVWLNEAQHYLASDPLGEQVAAGLRELLNDSSRGPVLVLGTLWPEHWSVLTTRSNPDRHASARELLSGHMIDVPAAFTPFDLTALDASDPRLAQAAEQAKSGQITQYLAGVPYLMDRYAASQGATRALIHAAMDARRLGAGPHLPLDWLAEAAPGYLDEHERHTLDRDWLCEALAYATTPCNGISGILTPVTGGGSDSQRIRDGLGASSFSNDQNAVSSLQRLRYLLLADYLEQHGRHHRGGVIPPLAFWTGAARHAVPADLTALGNAAWHRGLYRDATRLHRHAVAHGAPRAAVTLVRHLHMLRPADYRPAQWVAENVALNSPNAVAKLLMALREVGAHEQCIALAERAAAYAALDDPNAVAGLLLALWRSGLQEQLNVLLARGPAADVVLDDPESVADLLQALSKAGAAEEVTVLLARDPATKAPLDDPYAVRWLLETLRDVNADGQLTILAKRAATHVAVDNLDAVGSLLETLRDVNADEQLTILAKRAATHVAVDNLDAVGSLLETLRDVNADEQLTALARRVATHAALAGPSSVARALKMLWGSGATEQVAGLLSREPATKVSLDPPDAVGWLLEALLEVAAHEQVVVLGERAIAHVALDQPDAVAVLLDTFRKFGANEHIPMLLARDPAAHASLDDPRTASDLLRTLHEVGAQEQVTALLARAPATHANLDDPYAVACLAEALNDVGADEQVAVLVERAATHTPVDQPEAVAALLRTVRTVTSGRQITALLAERAAQHSSLDNPIATAMLLKALKDVGADEQVAVLVERATTHTPVDQPEAVAGLLRTLGEFCARESVAALLARDPATHCNLDDSNAVVMLFEALQKVGAHDQAINLARRVAGHAAPGDLHTVVRLLNALHEVAAGEYVVPLVEGLPAAGHFYLFINRGDNRRQFRLGREPNGSAAPFWSWDDLA
ncbi:hypothetical protein ACFY3G_19150 [Streptomyces phaeochromogenes]|uniref:hypothetical protein n=1 Tax=Streptomyces phaeochromogenes TaxID=1923 RepID=UPI003673D819